MAFVIDKDSSPRIPFRMVTVADEDITLPNKIVSTFWLKNDGTRVVSTNIPVEVEEGWYYLNPTTTEANTTGYAALDGIIFIPIDQQDETSYDNSPTSEGVFNGGTGYTASDSLTGNDGTVVTVDAVGSGIVTQFTIDSSASKGVRNGVAITFTGGTGNDDFTITPDTDNLVHDVLTKKFSDYYQVRVLPTLADFNAQCDLALADIFLDRLFATDYDPAAKPGSETALLNELVEDDGGGVSRYTVGSLDRVWAVAARILTANTNFNDISTTEVATELSNYGANTTVPPSAVAIVAAIFANVMENSETFAEQVRLIRAQSVGKVGVAGAINTFRDAADSKNRVTATVDAVGRRLSVIVDGS